MQSVFRLIWLIRSIRFNPNNPNNPNNPKKTDLIQIIQIIHIIFLSSPFSPSTPNFQIQVASCSRISRPRVAEHHRIKFVDHSRIHLRHFRSNIPQIKHPLTPKLYAFMKTLILYETLTQSLARTSVLGMLANPVVYVTWQQKANYLGIFARIFRTFNLF